MEQHRNINDTTIPLPQAIDLTTLWRQTYMNTFVGSAPADVLRGFRIPIEDIFEIGKNFPDAAYVRAYMCAKQNSTDPNDITLSVIIVPVGSDDIDILSYTDYQGQPQSAIYNFSQPCPPCCDVTSPLYDSTK